MSIVVEDGSGRGDAESYISVDDCTAYHAKRLNTAWASATAGAQEAALIKATEFLDHAYTWKGLAEYSRQALAWPRSGVSNERGDSVTGIPVEVQRASAEAALRALSGELVQDVAPNDRLQSKTESVEGAVSVAEVYRPGGATQTAYTVIERMLRGLILAPGTICLTRG